MDARDNGAAAAGRLLREAARRHMASYGGPTDPWSDAQAFAASLDSWVLDGLDDARAEDEARLRLLGPRARFGAAIVRGRVFRRVGDDVRQVWPRPSREPGGG